MFYLPIYKEVKPVVIPNEMQSMLDDESCEIIIAFSGGKDSVALVLYLLKMGISKSRITLHHHDVDGKTNDLFDWKCTPSYCQAFADAFELPIIFSWRKGGIKREILRTNEGLQDVFFDNGTITELKSRKGSSTRHKFPAVAADLRTRWCSSVVKIDVLSRVLNNTTSEGNFLILTGERRQESNARSKYKEFEKYRSWTKKRNAWQWRAIIDFTEKMVWDLYKEFKVQPHPCYELGWSRCSCQTCIFSSPNTWAAINEISPEKIVEIAELEKQIDHTLYMEKKRAISIYEKVEKGTSFITGENLERWGGEAIGEFVSDIFVSEWKLPQGAFSGESAGGL
jgi:3'-phosphoadenosine 5'-phosphosulfate sulfotransferase (PAPS reductase)/FAD synthetase